MNKCKLRLSQIRHSRWINAADKGGWGLRKIPGSSHDQLACDADECPFADATKHPWVTPFLHNIKGKKVPVFNFHRRRKTEEEQEQGKVARAEFLEKQKAGEAVVGDVEMLKVTVVDRFTFLGETCTRITKQKWEEAVARAKGAFRHHHFEL